MHIVSPRSPFSECAGRQSSLLWPVALEHALQRADTLIQQRRIFAAAPFVQGDSPRALPFTLSQRTAEHA
jgi:hypothetical protein